MEKKQVGENVLYPELSYTIMNVLFEVHNQLGPGFTEDIYEKAVRLELDARKIPYECEKTVHVLYKKQVLGTYRMDLIVDGKVILELKAVTALTDVHQQQVISYLKATHLHLGILANFGAASLQSCRIAL